MWLGVLAGCLWAWRVPRALRRGSGAPVRLSHGAGPLGVGLIVDEVPWAAAH